MNLSRIVNIAIVLDTAGISKVGFNTMAVLGVHAFDLSRSLTIVDVDDLTNLGFSETDALYLAASAAFNQTPRPKNIKILRWNPPSAAISVKTVASGTYSLSVSKKDSSGTVTSKTYTYTNSGTSAETILEGILAAITADANKFVTGSYAANVLTVTPSVAGTSIKYAVSSNMSVAFNTPTEAIAEAMTAITAEDNDWYGWALADRTPDNIMAAAAWSESHTKIFCTAIAESGAKDSSVTTDTGSLLNEKEYYRTHWWYHALAASEYLEVAIMARCFSIDPGGETWSLKSLAGITADGLTETEYTAVSGKNGNTYEKVRNISVTQNGKVAAGEWIDVIRFRDWLQEEMGTNIFTALKNSNKVSYTDAGIAIIESQMKKTLDKGVSVGGIAPVEYDDAGNKNPSYVVTVPLSSDITATVKASRVLTGVSFTARLSGAIHVVDVSGSLTYASLSSTDNSSAS